MPVLPVHGAEELAMVLRMVRRWADRDPRVRVEVVGDAGHLANHDNPAGFNEVLWAFLPEHVPAAGEA